MSSDGSGAWVGVAENEGNPLAKRSPPEHDSVELAKDRLRMSVTMLSEHFQACLDGGGRDGFTNTMLTIKVMSSVTVDLLCLSHLRSKYDLEARE